MQKTNSLTTTLFHMEKLQEQGCGGSGEEISGAHALMLFFSNLERSVTGVLCES